MKKVLVVLFAIILSFPFFTKPTFAARQSPPDFHFEINRGDVQYDAKLGKYRIMMSFANNSNEYLTLNRVQLELTVQDANSKNWYPIPKLLLDKGDGQDDKGLFSKVIAPHQQFKWEFDIDQPKGYKVAAFTSSSRVCFHSVPAPAKTYTVSKPTFLLDTASPKAKKVIALAVGTKVTFIKAYGDYYNVSINVKDKKYFGYVLKTAVK